MVRLEKGTIAFLFLLLLIASLSPLVFAAQLSAIAHPLADAQWSTQGQNLQNTWYSPQTLITPANVETLNQTWFTKIPNVAGTPIVSQSTGLVYVSSGGYVYGSIYALNESTGQIVWEDGPLNQTGLAFSTTAGIALDNGSIFAGTGSNQLVKLNATDGQPMWNVSATLGVIGNPGYYDGIPAAPLVYDGRVIVGESSSEVGARGFVRAFNESSGELLWTFYTVPPAPINSTDQEMYNNTWGSCYDCGGGDVWNTPATDGGVIYFGTGNPSPDYNSTERSRFPNQTNLFTDSVIALNATTGKLIWHYQETPADTHDYDQGMPVSVFQTPVNGTSTRVVGAGSKNGYYYLLNASNGSLIYKVKLGIHQNENVPPTPQGTIVYPGPDGGVNTFSSYDPLTNMIYTEAYNHPINLTSGAYNFTSGNYLGTQESEVSNIVPNSTFYSINASSGKILWSWNMPGNYSGGVSSTNDLLFTQDGNGTFYALDARNGSILWRYETGEFGGTYQGALWNFGPPSVTNDMIFETMIGNNGGVMVFSANLTREVTTTVSSSSTSYHTSGAYTTLSKLMRAITSASSSSDFQNPTSTTTTTTNYIVGTETVTATTVSTQTITSTASISFNPLGQYLPGSLIYLVIPALVISIAFALILTSRRHS